MIHARPSKLLYRTWLQLSLAILIGNLTALPLKAQASNSEESAEFISQLNNPLVNPIQKQTADIALPVSQTAPSASPPNFPANPPSFPKTQPIDLEQVPGSVVQPSEPQPSLQLQESPSNHIPPLPETSPSLPPLDQTQKPDFKYLDFKYLEEIHPELLDERIFVKRFVFEGNTGDTVSDRELAEATAPFTNRYVSFAELSQVTAAIEQLYAKRGDTTSRAYIPTNQVLPLSDGVLRINIVEGVADKVEIKEFKFEGNTEEVISDSELTEATASFIGRPISFDELLQARSAVTQVYAKHGYFTSGAYIPTDQTIEDGIVKIRVVEGSLEEIRVTGTRQLNPDYVASRLLIAIGCDTQSDSKNSPDSKNEIVCHKPLNRERLLEALQLIQRDLFIESLDAELSAGSSPGLNRLDVRVREARPFRSQLSIDNARSPSVGSVRRRVELNYANLLGRGDDMSLAYTNTDGSNAVDFAYSVPVGPSEIDPAFNDSLILRFGNSWATVIESPFNRLDIKTPTRYFDLTFRRQVIQTFRRELAFSATFSRRENETSILGFDIPLFAGADDEGRTLASALRLSGEWVQRSPQDALAALVELSVGIKSAKLTSTPDSRFLTLRGQVQWGHRLAPDSLLLIRSGVQLANRTLLPLEQLGLGGQETVRGYRQDLLLTDNGVFASAEAQLPILRLPKLQGILQIIPFIDFGTGWNSSGMSSPDPSTLLSTGLGLQFQLGDRFTGRLDWGIPLISVDSKEKTLQEQGLHFSVIWRNSF